MTKPSWDVHVFLMLGLFPCWKTRHLLYSVDPWYIRNAVKKILNSDHEKEAVWRKRAWKSSEKSNKTTKTYPRPGRGKKASAGGTKTESWGARWTRWSQVLRSHRRRSWPRTHSTTQLSIRSAGRWVADPLYLPACSVFSLLLLCCSSLAWSKVVLNLNLTWIYILSGFSSPLQLAHFTDLELLHCMQPIGDYYSKVWSTPLITLD